MMMDAVAYLRVAGYSENPGLILGVTLLFSPSGLTPGEENLRGRGYLYTHASTWGLRISWEQNTAARYSLTRGS